MKRREFLKYVGLAAAASSVPGVFTQAQGQAPAGVKINDEHAERIAFDEGGDIDAKLSEPVTAIIIGAGNRGGRYSSYGKQYPGSLSIVGVSDIIDERKDRMGDAFGIPAEHRFGDWSEVFKVPRFADAVVISTPDSLHHKPCLKALEMGYNVLLEKPIAQSEQECREILAQARKYDRIVVVCHVLRYSPYFGAMRESILSGKIGEVVSVQHLEPIGAYHMAHSYVRGNWHNSKETTPILLAKSCHDIDLLSWATGKQISEVSAFGDLSFFTARNAPEGSTPRCLDCPEEEGCAFSARRYYYDQRKRNNVFIGLPADEPQRGEQLLDRLRTTDYGRCVFRMDNDQCDHYVMNIRFSDGATAAFSMEGLTSYEGRLTRIMGTRGDIVGDMRRFTVTDFRTGKKSFWEATSTDGHGGGDARLVRDFVRAVSAGDESLATSTIEASVESHITGYRAERSRLTGKIEKL